MLLLTWTKSAQSKCTEQGPPPVSAGQMCGSRHQAAPTRPMEKIDSSVVQQGDHGLGGTKFLELHTQTVITGGVALIIMIILILLAIAIARCWWERIISFCGGHQDTYIGEYHNEDDEERATVRRVHRPRREDGSPHQERRRSRDII